MWLGPGPPPPGTLQATEPPLPPGSNSNCWDCLPHPASKAHTGSKAFEGGELCGHPCSCHLTHSALAYTPGARGPAQGVDPSNSTCPSPPFLTCLGELFLSLIAHRRVVGSLEFYWAGSALPARQPEACNMPRNISMTGEISSWLWGSGTHGVDRGTHLGSGTHCEEAWVCVGHHQCSGPCTRVSSVPRAP